MRAPLSTASEQFRARFRGAFAGARLSLAALAVLGLCSGAAAEPAGTQPGTKSGPKSSASRHGRRTGLSLPRFVSLRADEVNVRTGPGKRYPILWTFRRLHLPVEIIAEFDIWRKIRDWEGAEGWLHQAALARRRTILVTGQIRTLRRKASPDARALAHLEPGVTGRLLECRGAWCRVKVKRLRGWLKRGDFYGTYARERIVR